MSGRTIRYHRYVSWGLVLFSLSTIVTGLTLSRGWVPDQYLMSVIHRISEIPFLALLILHIIITLRSFPLNFRRTVNLAFNSQNRGIHFLRLGQRISSWLLVISALLVVIPGLNGYELIAMSLEDTVPFSFHRFFDIFFVALIIVHVTIGIRFYMMRRGIKHRATGLVLLLMASSLLIVDISLNVSVPSGSFGDVLTPSSFVVPTDYEVSAVVLIGERTYGFDPKYVDTVRPDVFKPGRFSMFDVIVHLDSVGLINLDYSFNASMNTHVIHSIDGSPDWWYIVTYSGGWPEGNVFRMDLYLWKNGTELWLRHEPHEHIERIYESFIEEVDRLSVNSGKVIIPRVVLLAPEFRLEFLDVNVTPHNLRSDTFQEDVIAAIDVIMTLGDQGAINYTLQWYEEIGDAEVVQSFWVESINERVSRGTCGWVYESGDTEFDSVRGNHIHLPSDVRVLTSPEYTFWFWICI